MLNDRRRLVLKAVVEEYVSSAQPVGSRTLVERYGLACSPATVRAELSALEEYGHLVQPHTSAGRIPTDSGYRSVVDGYLASFEEDPTSELRDGSLDTTSEVTELLGAASASLARHTNSLGIAIGPSIETARVMRVDLLALGERRVLFVLITDSGQVLNRQVDLAMTITPEEVAAVERTLNASLRSKQTRDIARLRAALVELPGSAHGEGGYTPAAIQAMTVIIDEVIDALREADGSRLKHRGFASLLAQPEFHDSGRLGALVQMLDDQLDMVQVIFDDGGASAEDPISVRIGHENRHVGLGEVSVIISPYRSGSAQGVVGVIGPTRMDYRRAIGAVKATADRLTDTLNS